MSTDGVRGDVFDADDHLAAFASELRAAAALTPAPVVGEALGRLFADGLPPTTATAPEPVAPRRRRARRLVVAATALVVGTGGLGVAGALPAPVQRAVADVADVVGVRLPTPDRAERGPEPATEPAPAPAPAAPDTPATTVPVPRPAAPARSEPSAPGRPEAPPGPERGDERGRGDEQGRGGQQRAEAGARADGAAPPAGAADDRQPPAAGRSDEVGGVEVPVRGGRTAAVDVDA